MTDPTPLTHIDVAKLSAEIAAWVALAGVVSTAVGRAYNVVLKGGGLKHIFSAIWLGSTTAPKPTDNNTPTSQP